MPLFEVEKILEKRIGEKNQEMYLIKWLNYNRPSWTRKSNMNCYKTIIDFEVNTGPQILGAKRNPVSGNLEYLIQMKGEITPKVITSAFHFRVPIILYLQSKIEWHDNGTSQRDDRRNDVVVAGTPKKVLYASCASSGGLTYIFQTAELEEVMILAAETAIIEHPQLVLDYLQERIE